MFDDITKKLITIYQKCCPFNTKPHALISNAFFLHCSSSSPLRLSLLHPSTYSTVASRDGAPAMRGIAIAVVMVLRSWGVLLQPL